MTAHPDIVIRTRLAASPEIVYDAWTTERGLVWFPNPEQPVGPQPIEVDAQPGGAWTVEMRENAASSYLTGGLFRDLDPARRIRFAWGHPEGWPRRNSAKPDSAPQVEVLLRPDGEHGTLLSLEVRIPDGALGDVTRADCEAGWRSTLARLEAALRHHGPAAELAATLEHDRAADARRLESEASETVA